MIQSSANIDGIDIIIEEGYGDNIGISQSFLRMMFFAIKQHENQSHSIG